jgi:hypothetical protein
MHLTNKRTRKIDKIVIENMLFCNQDWRAYVICVDENGNCWELRAISATYPAEAIANALEAFDEEDWNLYGYIISEKT